MHSKQQFNISQVPTAQCTMSLEMLFTDSLRQTKELSSLLQFDQFIHSKVLEPSNYNSYDLETRRDFKDYTRIEPQTFKEEIIQNIDSIKQRIVERAHHEQELENRLKRLSERKLQIQECKIQKVKASDASSGETDRGRIVSDKGNDQGLENQSNTSRDESSRSRNECNDKSTSGDDTDIRTSYDTEPMVEVDSNVIPDSPDMCDNEIQTDHNVVECDDECVALANLIANLKLDVNENKKIQKQLKKANASLTQELKYFAKLEKRLISLKLALQHCQEQMKNDTVRKEKASNVFLKEREQYFKIQDLKAQLQDKNIAISELKKLVEKFKEKSVETKFDKPSVVRQPNA
ncbi:hypothetical protein Tco_1067023 [Tanacetum coccineum]|uniref:Uncharacterized protein n=1 Tax=Tanacetum coccineum TaxID=301880 RepID=A0ABQ5HBP7_9ASTR